MGGSKAVTLENIEKFFVIRGILEPVKGNELTGAKDKETHAFITKSSLFAGEEF